MNDCLFCKIINGEIPSTKVYEDDDVYAFEDINPMAKVHILIIPKKHIATIADIEAEDEALIGKIFLAAKKIAEDKGMADDGYRIVNNCKAFGGQEVFHLHFHLLGGEKLGVFAK